MLGCELLAQNQLRLIIVERKYGTALWSFWCEDLEFLLDSWLRLDNWLKLDNWFVLDNWFWLDDRLYFGFRLLNCWLLDNWLRLNNWLRLDNWLWLDDNRLLYCRLLGGLLGLLCYFVILIALVEYEFDLNLGLGTLLIGLNNWRNGWHWHICNRWLNTRFEARHIGKSHLLVCLTKFVQHNITLDIGDGADTLDILQYLQYPL